ncbi:hypothetical protein, partial [Nocardia abscessus]|uniref:hypothetical protein n=1 Tax=Nocardia abscessus TaxID=120957 RepID=UPI002455A722
ARRVGDRAWPPCSCPPQQGGSRSQLIWVPDQPKLKLWPFEVHDRAPRPFPLTSSAPPPAGGAPTGRQDGVAHCAGPETLADSVIRWRGHR